MQREHHQPGLRPGNIAGAPQGFQVHPHALGAGGSALSVAQSVSMQDLRMASQNVTGFQPPRTQHYPGSPQNAQSAQNAHAGPSGHPNPGQNIQNGAQGYYRNVQAAPGPIRSNSTPHAQFAPYPQPQYSNGYAQVITGHGHYPASPANHPQNLVHDGRRASMPSLNAGPPQTNQAFQMQVSQPSNASGRQNAQTGSSSMQQAPEPPRPRPQPHGPERNPSAVTSFQPASASAPAPPHPQFPQTPQASAPSQSSNALPTPPSTSAGPSNAPSAPAHVQDAMALISQSTDRQARSILIPMRDSIADSLNLVHAAFTEELSKAHVMFVKSETKAVQAQISLANVREELAQACAERDRALERCEHLKQEREVALEDIRKMNENLPKLVVEHYQLKAEHDALRSEVETLREANAQLREKARLSLNAALQAVPPSLLRQATDISSVKLEFPTATPGGVESGAVAQVKEEHGAMKESNSPTDVDADVAFALVQDFKVRKQKHRDQADPEHERPRSVSGQHLLPPSEAPAASSLTRVNFSPFNVPPTPPAELSPRSRRISLGNTATAQEPPSRSPSGTQSLDALASTHFPKLEDVDGSQPAILSSIPELNHIDVTGELDIIDLTLDCEMTESPTNLAPDLPPLSHCAPENDPSEERRRTVEPEWNDRQETPNKRQRTADEVDAPATQDAVMQDGNSQEVKKAFTHSLSSAASQDTLRLQAEQITAAPAPVPSAVPPHHGDGQDTEPSPALGAEYRSDGSNDRVDRPRELGRTEPSSSQPVTNATGLLTPLSPSPTTIHLPIPRPAQRSESGPRQAPNIVLPTPVPSASIAPAVSSTSSPTGVVQRPLVSGWPLPPPAPSAPATSSPPLLANSSPSSSAPPPRPPPTRKATKPLPPSLSVATSSSSQGKPTLPSASPSQPTPQIPPVTPVVNALAGINLSLPSPTNAVHLPTGIPVPASPPKLEPPKKKLGINHIDLVYRRVGSGYYQCRFCERRRKEVPACPSTKFAANAPGFILIEHVEKEHPTSVQRMLGMTPEDIRENKLRLESADKGNASVLPKKRKSTG